MESCLDRVKVIAFVGPAGTGKSLRAQFVARQLDIDFIIDDGLVISRGRIVAGKSAKTEKNMIKAIRRAMFLFPEHREEVHNFLCSKAPCSLMLIATSSGMAQKICKALVLKEPEKYIEISEIATAEEIARARYERKHKRQHVIPVSQAQIRKNYTGKLVGKLRNMFRVKDNYEKTIVRPPFTFYGNIKIDPDVVFQIAKHVISSGIQIVSSSDIQVRDVNGIVSIRVSITAKTGSRSLLEVASNLSRRIKLTVEFLCGLDVKSVDIDIEKVIIDAD